MANALARFRLCRACERNASVGFIGPPECDLQVMPAADGSCAHHTTEMIEVAADPTVSVGKKELVGALALLKPVATRSRFAGSQPIMVAVGQDSLELRAVDGETDVRITHGVVGPAARRTVVPLEVFLAAVDTDQVTLSIPGGKALTVGETGVAGVTASTLPGPFEVGDSGALLPVPPLTETCTYLVRAVNREETRPVLRHVLMELPDFTFVATDGHRLHVQWTKPDSREHKQRESTVLLTKEQLALLWESQLTEKQLAVTNRGCVVTGALGALHVDMAFTTGSGQFPDWRSLLEAYENSTSMGIESVRHVLREEGKLFEVGKTVKILKEHVRDVIVGWVDDRVGFLYKDAQSPVVLNGSDRQAVLIHAQEVAVEQSAGKEVPKMKKHKKDDAVQTSAPVATLIVQQYTVGQTVTTKDGAIEIQNARICYLVRMPDGKRRWFNQAGVNRMAAGQTVEEEAASEAAA